MNEAQAGPVVPVVPVDPLLGTTLHGTYMIEKLLGLGGMGAVYAARHMRLPKRFAIKVLHAQMALNQDVFARFRREAEITSALGHQHIVEVVDFNQLENGMPYLVMEFLQGEDLYALLKQRERLPLKDALEIARQVGSALQAAHDRGVVHRDLKPQNIFLVRQEELGRQIEIAKVVDFGISKIRNPEVSGGPATSDGALLGTPSYMSPEQAAGRNTEIDGRTDQYALATILYEMLSGRVAFMPEAGEGLTGVLIRVVTKPAPPLRELAPEVPGQVVAAIERAMAKDPAARFGSVTELLAALGALGERQAAGSEKAAEPRSERAAGPGTTPAARPVGGPQVVASGLTFGGGPSLLTQSGPPPQGAPAPQVKPVQQSVVPVQQGVAVQQSVVPVQQSVAVQQSALVPQPSLVAMGPIGGSIKPAAEISIGKWLLWGTAIGGGGLLLLVLLVLRLLSHH